MALVNYASAVLRASAATSGAEEQDAAVTLPESVNEIWVVMEKTAEANADNLLTVRLQALVASLWFDVSWTSQTPPASVTSAADNAADVTRTPNIIDTSSVATFSRIVHYAELPSNVIRIISISSGTTAANTFSANAIYRNNQR